LTSNENITFNVTMKERMIKYLDRMAKECGCSTRSEYLRNVVRWDAESRGIKLEPKPRSKKVTE
jgi:metal-responsive CopG/Arc/MetJ family transcriptional regulator